MDLRKTVISMETIQMDSFGKPCSPVTRVAALAVITNPFAGQYVEDLSPLFDRGGELGEQLMGRITTLLPGSSTSRFFGRAAGWREIVQIVLTKTRASCSAVREPFASITADARLV